MAWAAAFKGNGSAGDWESPFDGGGRGRPIASNSEEWDREHAAGLLRILTINMHGRPIDLGRTTGSGGALQFPEDASATMVDCDDEYHLANAQDRRMRGLFEWLDALPDHVRPHILCLQEVIWRPMVNIAERELARRGFVTLPSISLREDRGCATCVPPRAGSGLGIYVQQRDGLEPVDGDRMMFDERLGTDWLVEKGVKWMAVAVAPSPLAPNGATLMVATTHPQAYNQLNRDSPPGESWFTSLLRQAALADLDWRGGYPYAISDMHRRQYRQAAAYLRDTALPRTRKAASGRRLPLLGAFVGADLNVNRFAVTPSSPEEADPARSVTATVSREFQAAVGTLRCRQPRIVRETSASIGPEAGGVFTWDGTHNSMAAPLLPTAAPAHGWIDAVLACSPDGRCPAPAYMDNRAVRLRLGCPCPELGPFWLSPCARWRARALADADLAPARRAAYAAANRLAAGRLAQGRAQFFRLASAFLRDGSWANCVGLLTGRRPDLADGWASAVRAAPDAQSSQVWKGLEFYGLQPSDLYARAAARIPIGAPHPFRMINDVSDHHGVLARIRLPSAKTQ